MESNSHFRDEMLRWRDLVNKLAGDNAVGMQKYSIAGPSQEPTTPTNLHNYSDGNQKDIDLGKINLLDHINERQRQHGQSPISLENFKIETPNLLLKLWGPRLCPDGVVSNDVHQTLTQIGGELPTVYHYLLSICALQFQVNRIDSVNWKANPICWVNWKFFEFTFYEISKITRLDIIYEMQKKWDSDIGIKLNIETTLQWIIWVIDERIKVILSSTPYPLCPCAIDKSHSYNDLPRRVKELETLDKNQREAKVKLIVIAYVSIMVFDQIKKVVELEESHPSWQNDRRVVKTALDELLEHHGDEEFPEDLQAIVAYEKKLELERLSRLKPKIV